MRIIHSPETPLDCCSLAGLNRAALPNLAPVWSVIVRQEWDVWGSIWVISCIYGLSLCVCVAGGGGACGETRFPRALLHVLHRKGHRRGLGEDRANPDDNLGMTEQGSRHIC